MSDRPHITINILPDNEICWVAIAIAAVAWAIAWSGSRAREADARIAEAKATHAAKSAP